jgi:hypothetical protein
LSTEKENVPYFRCGAAGHRRDPAGALVDVVGQRHLHEDAV